MKGRCSALLGAAILLSSTTEAAREVDRPRLVGFDELAARLDEPNLRLLDARPRADFERGHIPGALWVDVKAAEELAARPGGLEDRQAWSAWASPLAIAPDATVLVYDDSRQLAAARVWWLLTYLGVEDAGLVDGSFALWREQGRPISKEESRIEPVPFRVDFRAGRHADRDQVLAAIREGSAQVLDARSPGEYVGRDKLSKKAGHVPGACSLEWTQLVDEKGRFLDEEALRTKLDEAGVRPGKPVITHCQGGGRASVEAFALERLGVPTRNYYLGWSDWGNAEGTPVAEGEEPGEVDEP